MDFELRNLDGRAHADVRFVDVAVVGVEVTIVADIPRAVVVVAARRTSPIVAII